MIEKDKLKLNKKDIRFFLVPFIILAVLTATMIYTTSKSRIKEAYEMLEYSTSNIVDSYSKILVNSKEASEIITRLLNEKIVVASEVVLLMDNAKNNDNLKEIAEKFQVDQINLYNSNGEIIFSNTEEYIGWQVYDGHPINKFINGIEKVLVEDIRQDTVNKLFYKYGYLKKDDNTFVQIGVLAENVHEFTKKFRIEEFFEEILTMDNVEDVFFIDLDYKIVSSSKEEYNGTTIQDLEIREQLYGSKTMINQNYLNGNKTLNVYAPVFYGGEKLGTLSIVLVSDFMRNETRRVMVSGIIEFFIFIIIIGIILYYAYKKDRSNVKAAYYDSLTGLPNNKYLQEYLQEVINRSGGSKKAIMLLNGANFKVLNMTYSFRYGDYVLVQIAKGVKELLGPENMLFRFNGDRFVIVMYDYTDSKELEDIAEKTVHIFNNVSYEDAKHEYFKAEISIVEIHDENILVDKVLRNATHALTYLKADANDQIIFYNKDTEIKSQRDNKIEQVLSRVLGGEDKESFYLEFQPKLNIKTKEIVGFEALARLNIEGMGKIPPLEFIDLAERRMLIYDLGKMILQKSCKFCKKLKELGYDNMSIAVNISVMQLLRDEFVDDVKKYIIESGANVETLELEITESVIIDNFDFINKKLEELGNFGLAISLDDFGTGFSSFSRLRDLKIDTVKIDKHFIDRVSIEDEDKLISTDIISMAHKIGLKIIAEGVEEERQREYLEKHDCDIIQGYLISRPLGEDKAIEFLKTYKENL